MTLGIDQFGYRSVHYVAQLTDERLSLPEYHQFSGCKFEIQIRTILEHAWAEITHDREYKFRGVLPAQIKRDFALISAMLERADRDFDSLSKQIDSYAEEVEFETKKGNLDIAIDTTSLREYLNQKLPAPADSLDIAPNFNGYDDEIIDELNKYGINTLADLDAVIKIDSLEKYLKESNKSTNYLGILRYIMMLDNPELYFDRAWSNHWKGLTKDGCDALRANGIAPETFASKYSLWLPDDYHSA